MLECPAIRARVHTSHPAAPRRVRNVLAINPTAPAPVSPIIEMGAYEALWLEKTASFKTLAKKFRSRPESLPSDFVPMSTAVHCANVALEPG
jgi:hypothetical protein